MQPPIRWTFRDQFWDFGTGIRLMGIVNVTPDSFSDGGEFASPERAVAHALQLAADGADVLDIGGESTRPGSSPVSAAEELDRVAPVIEQLRPQTTVPISIDTTKAVVAREALRLGAEIVNDISGLTFDPDMPAVCAEFEAGVICMHIQGTPATMQVDPRYDDVVSEVADWLQARLIALEQAGIDPARVMLDPGIGFGKTAEHNLQLMQHLPRLKQLGRPILVGHSRKRFLGKILGRTVDERQAGTIGVSVALAARGADLLRVHDVRAIRDALVAWQTIATDLPQD